jgi:hypothetical protein
MTVTFVKLNWSPHLLFRYLIIFLVIYLTDFIVTTVTMLELSHSASLIHQNQQINTHFIWDVSLWAWTSTALYNLLDLKTFSMFSDCEHAKVITVRSILAWAYCVLKSSTRLNSDYCCYLLIELLPQELSWYFIWTLAENSVSWVFLWFSSVPPGKFQDGNIHLCTETFFHIPLYSWFTLALYTSFNGT